MFIDLILIIISEVINLSIWLLFAVIFKLIFLLFLIIKQKMT